MVDNNTTTNHRKSELDKFRVYYELITPPEKRETHKVTAYGMRHSRSRSANK